ncbi:MAG: Crp/Fnr family transcriptional regulator [Hyphomicrobiaceae bacterium]|nr:Crp/Fnr family transcriptional regulator [Hyphomicrobiaceae bacterium]
MSVASGAVEVLKKASLFEGLQPNAVAAIAGMATELTLEEGDDVYTLGDEASAVYVVTSGRIRFSLGVGNRASAAHSIMEAGQAFGWAALIGDEPRRVATATCLEDTTLLAIDGKKLTAYFETDTASGYAVMRRLADRISRDLLSALTN